MKTKGIIGLAFGCSLLGGIVGGVLTCIIGGCSSSIAVVNVPEIVASSAQVKQLQAEQAVQLQQLTSLVKKAQEEIAKEKNSAKKTELEKKYTEELNAKKAAFDAAYTVQLGQVSENMLKTISEEAKSMGYRIVLSKEATLGGADDITKEMIGKIK